MINTKEYIPNTTYYILENAQTIANNIDFYTRSGSKQNKKMVSTITSKILKFTSYKHAALNNIFKINKA